MSIDIDRNQSALATLELAIEDDLPAIVLARASITSVWVTWMRDQAQPFVVVRQAGELQANVASFEDLDDALDCLEGVINGEWNKHEQTLLATWWDTYVAEAGKPAQVAGVA